jgi:hypothetical protein
MTHLQQFWQFSQFSRIKIMHRKIKSQTMKFPWIYMFIEASGIEMGFRESLFAMKTGAYLRPLAPRMHPLTFSEDVDHPCGCIWLR